MGKSKATLLLKESYLARITSAVGTRMFRRLYALVNGKKQDILGNGDRSCSLFVSTVLVGFHLVKEVHVTVSSTMRDMGSSGWTRICYPRIGCVIVWQRTNDTCSEHQHIGFYLGKGKAISNSSKKGYPTIHPYRIHKVDELYWHKKLK